MMPGGPAVWGLLTHTQAPHSVGQNRDRRRTSSIYTPASGVNIREGEGAEEVSPAAQQREQQVLRS